MNPVVKKDLIALIILVAILTLVAYTLSLRAPGAPSPAGTATTTNEKPASGAAPNIPVEPSELTITAKINKPASGLGVTVAPLEVVEDSRCPSDVVCIQAGTARVRSGITSGLGKGEIIFKLNTPITTEAERVELIQVLPEARSEIPIRANEYRFIFKITKIKE